MFNAKSVAEKGAALMFEEKDLTPEKLAVELSRLLADKVTAEKIKDNIKKIKTEDSAKIMVMETEKICC